MDKKVQFRMSEKEKERLEYLASVTGAKNKSDFIRSYINEMYDFLVPCNKVNFDQIINDLKKEKENVKDSFSRFSIQNKISLLEQLQEDYEK